MSETPHTKKAAANDPIARASLPDSAVARRNEVEVEGSRARTQLAKEEE